jgi:hypothetical protein
MSAPADFGLIKPDAYHPPLIIYNIFPIVEPLLHLTEIIQLTTVLCSIAPYLRVIGLMCTIPSSVDGAVGRLSATMHDAMQKSIPYSHVRKSKFPPWFSKALRYYIAKKYYYYRRFPKK